MMQRVALQVLTASAVFYLLMLALDVLVQGAALNAATLMATFFITLIFAMAYAAIRVALVMFRGDDK